jgi:hypothetical protein
MNTLNFSNGVTIDSTHIVSVESNQQTIQLPGGIGELEHLLRGRPSALLIRLRDGSAVEINAGHARLNIQVQD